MDRRHNWLMFIRLCSIRYGLTEYLRGFFVTPFQYLKYQLANGIIIVGKLRSASLHRFGAMWCDIITLQS